MNTQLIATQNLPPELTAHNNRVYRLLRVLDDEKSVLVLTDWGLLFCHAGEWCFWTGPQS